ncbi:hypothetical protein N5C93_29230 [Pseudomonas nitroreducens]|uniref:hypothetical protein n=1 Tax=Pseudomonas nitroreducens TaxID=46680 RepID=UPI0014752F28|nr:hypothetical protein [Pseudomonas nitroreducens]MDG9855223.1 hypothetical protein [Pseudomonas nitroreducens]MDH1076923.1 hypothetical protein [Pseudomonas nitroreducens]NMZ73198.1 hypothetical protein [Pseudomonas nitroreducens]
MLALKLTLVPLFLLLVSLSGRWWGPAVAGCLAALPAIAGPILYLITVEHGRDFGAHAALLALAAIFAAEAFNFAYAWICRRHGWLLALTGAMLAWLVAGWALTQLPASPVWALLAAAVGTLTSQLCMPRAELSAAVAPLGRFELGLRMLAGALLTLAVTALAGWAGPSWSGLLAVFPLLSIVLCVSSQRLHGPGFVIALLRGMVTGRPAFAAFCLCLALRLPGNDVLPSFAEAALLAVLLQGTVRWLIGVGSRRLAKAA